MKQFLQEFFAPILELAKMPSIGQGDRPSWTVGLVIKKKPIKFAALVILLTIMQIRMLDPVLTKIVRGLGIKGNAPGVVFFVLILILAVLLSGVILKALSNLRLAFMSPEKAQELFERQCRFFWSRMYSLVIGYLFLGFMVKTMTSLEFIPNHPLVEILAEFVFPLVVTHLLVRLLNWAMIKATGTNKKLIEDLKSGRYDAEIPAKHRNEESMRGILSALENAEANSVQSAILVYRLKKTLHSFYKQSAKHTGKFFVCIAAIGMIIGLGSSKATEDIAWQIAAELKGKAGAGRKERKRGTTLDIFVTETINHLRK